jgi:hypothetical protein
MIKLLSSLTPEQLEMSSHLMEKLQFALDPIARISSFFKSMSSSSNSSSAEPAVVTDKKGEISSSHELSATTVAMALHTTQSKPQEVPIRITVAQRYSEPKSSPTVAVTVKKTFTTTTTTTTSHSTVEKPSRQQLVEKPSAGHNRKMF